MDAHEQTRLNDAMRNQEGSSNLLRRMRCFVLVLLSLLFSMMTPSFQASSFQYVTFNTMADPVQNDKTSFLQFLFSAILELESRLLWPAQKSLAHNEASPRKRVEDCETGEVSAGKRGRESAFLGTRKKSRRAQLALPLK